MRKFTSTQLNRESRTIVKTVLKNPDEPVVIYNHKDPEVVIISYSTWKKRKRLGQKLPALGDLEKYMIKTGKKIDTAKMIREWRDAE
ncbi:MAG: type II toxin-antitoxin system Phd/YefM family antitoxin [Candidatus Dojkabacteria bacterium]